MPEELWTEVNDIVQDAVIKTISKIKAKRHNGCLDKALQIAEKRSKVKGKGEKERYIHLNAEFQRITERQELAFLIGQCKQRGKQ